MNYGCEMDGCGKQPAKQYCFVCVKCAWRSRPGRLCPRHADITRAWGQGCYSCGAATALMLL